jgi:hypothetical protein
VLHEHCTDGPSLGGVPVAVQRVSMIRKRDVSPIERRKRMYSCASRRVMWHGPVGSQTFRCVSTWYTVSAPGSDARCARHTSAYMPHEHTNDVMATNARLIYVSVRASRSQSNIVVSVLSQL